MGLCELDAVAGESTGTVEATATLASSSGYLEYGGSSSVCPSGPTIACSSPSGPICLWKLLFLPGNPICTIGEGSWFSSSGIEFCWYKPYGWAGPAGVYMLGLCG